MPPLIESITLPASSSRPPVPVRNTILYGCSALISSFAAKSALTLRICPARVSPRLAITGIEPALRLASIAARLTRSTLPTRPYLLGSRKLVSNTPLMIEVARASTFCSASTSFRFSACDTRRTMASAAGEVTRRPSTVSLMTPAALISASSCGPAPWITIGVRPTCCRNASEETRLSRSSRSTAPPTLTTANFFASSCEKRRRYWSISLALPMLESRRTMVWRVCVLVSISTGLRFHDVDVALCDLLQLRELDEFIRGMRLGDVAGAADDRGVARLREQRGFGPEVDRVADRQADLVGEVARLEAA